MARFQFKLDPVLFKRRAEEDGCQRDLAKSLRQRMVLRDQLRMMQQAIGQSKQQLAGGLQGQVDVSQVLQFAQYSGQVTHRAHAFVVRLSVVEKQIDAGRNRLMEATRARKALEILRDRRYQQWRRQTQRREDAQMDELAVQRHGRLAAMESGR